MNELKTLATFATAMRAASLQEDLNQAGIDSIRVQPKWTNKRLPPPRFEVQVAESYLAAAQQVLANFKKEVAR